MLLGVITELACGALCIVLGIIIWSKRKTSLLHDYHYANVQDEDIPAYTKQIGIGLILIGVGIALAGLFDLFYSPLWWIPLAVGIAAGFLVMHKAQKKYNGSWLG